MGNSKKSIFRDVIMNNDKLRSDRIPMVAALLSSDTASIPIASQRNVMWFYFCGFQCNTGINNRVTNAMCQLLIGARNWSHTQYHQRRTPLYAHFVYKAHFDWLIYNKIIIFGGKMMKEGRKHLMHGDKNGVYRLFFAAHIHSCVSICRLPQIVTSNLWS